MKCITPITQKDSGLVAARTVLSQTLAPDRNPHDVAVKLVERIKGADETARNAALEGISDTPMALAYVAILAKEDTAAQLKAVELIGDNIPALKEVFWRASGPQYTPGVLAALKKISSLSEPSDDIQVLTITACNSSDAAARLRAAEKIIIEADNPRDIAVGATYSHFSETRAQFLDALISMGDRPNIVSVALGCYYPDTPVDATEFIARTGTISELMNIFRYGKLPVTKETAIEKAVANNPEGVVYLYREANNLYPRVLEYTSRLLRDIVQTANGTAFNPVDMQGFSNQDLVLLAAAVLKDSRWDPQNAGNPSLRAARLLYSLSRVSAYFEENDWNSRTGDEINGLLRRNLGLTKAQTEDIEWQANLEAKAAK